MTESEWLACTEPAKMLEFLRGTGSDRKLRLFAIACARDTVHLVSNKILRQCFVIATRFADKQTAPVAALDHVKKALAEVRDWGGESINIWYAKNVIRAFASDDGMSAAERILYCFGYASSRRDKARLSPKQSDYCDYLKDIFGNPFRPVCIPPSWLTWQGGTVPQLADRFYKEWDLDHLSILADALEEAGCDQADLLDHLRGPGVHVRGCWVLDLLLGKE